MYVYLLKRSIGKNFVFCNQKERSPAIFKNTQFHEYSSMHKIQKARPARDKESGKICMDKARLIPEYSEHVR